MDRRQFLLYSPGRPVGESQALALCRPQNRNVQKTLVVDKNICEESRFTLLQAVQDIRAFKFVCYWLWESEMDVLGVVLCAARQLKSVPAVETPDRLSQRLTRRYTYTM